MLAVSVPVLFVYEMTGGPGPFHALAVVSLLTTARGWLAVRRRGPSRPGVAAHGTFMVWSWIRLGWPTVRLQAVLAIPTRSGHHADVFRAGELTATGAQGLVLRALCDRRTLQMRSLVSLSPRAAVLLSRVVSI